jgi:hypothetical protein
VTETTKYYKVTALEMRAIEMYTENWDNAPGFIPWEKLDDYKRELWRKRAQETPPPIGGKYKVASGLKLELLPPYALEAIEETKVDPRTHDKKVHAAFEAEWNDLVRELRLLAKPSDEDLENRKVLLELGFPVFSAAAEGANSLSLAGTGSDE